MSWIVSPFVGFEAKGLRLEVNWHNEVVATTKIIKAEQQTLFFFFRNHPTAAGLHNMRADESNTLLNKMSD